VVVGAGIGGVVGVGIGGVGLVLPGSGFLGSGTGIGSGDSIGVGIGVVVGVGNCGVDVGIGVGDGLPIGFVGLRMVVLWAISVPGGCANELEAAIDRKLIEIMAIIGTKNKIAGVKIR
jgi:hypothetical protein